LSEKLHLETGLAFNTTRYSLRDLLQQRKQFQTWLIPLGSMVRAGLSYRFTKTRRFMRPFKGFSTPTVWKH
jgi:iron complex outermembrane receptor protein